MSLKVFLNWFLISTFFRLTELLFAAPGAPLDASRCRRGRSCRRKSWYTQPGPPRRSGQRQCGRRLRRQAPAKRPPASMAEGRGRADTCCARARWVAELVASKSREAVTGRRRRQRNYLLACACAKNSLDSGARCDLKHALAMLRSDLLESGT